MKVSIVGAALLAVLGLATPALATPAVAATCGTTADQWVGDFTGTEDARWEQPVRMDLFVTSTADGLAAETDVYIYNDTLMEQLHAPVIENGKLIWSAYYWNGAPSHYSFGHNDYYTTTNVTCSGGQVTQFNGTVRIKFYPSYEERTGTFTISR